MKKVVTIAGSDCSGGAGIQADLKTMTMHGVYGMSIITALTAQNTTGVYGVLDTPPSFVAQQFDCVFTDIFPDAVKIGMVSNVEILLVIAEKLTQYKVPYVVVDPVMVATSGGKLLAGDAVETLKTHLFPLASLITPNIPEAEALSGTSIKCKADMVDSAFAIAAQNTTAVLIKGGHLDDCADDLLLTNGTITWFPGEKIQTKNTHGTGCTLSSAIASNLALGYTLIESIQRAKTYLTGALKMDCNLGSGNGPLNHCYSLSINEPHTF